MKRNTNFKNVFEIDRELQIHDFHVDGNINPLREIREKEHGKLEENIVENDFFRSSGRVILINEKIFIDQNKKRLRKEKRRTKAMGNRQKRRRENREILVEE